MESRTEMIAAAAELLTGVFGLIVLVLVLLFSIVWLIFPFVVGTSLSRIERRLMTTNATLDKIAERANETNRALQFLVNKK